MMIFRKSFFTILIYLFCGSQIHSEDIIINIDFKKYLETAKNYDKRAPLLIDLVVLNENLVLIAKQNDVIDDTFSRIYPNIYTYDVTDQNTGTSGTMTLSESGIYITMFLKGKLISIFPSRDQKNPDKHIIDTGDSTQKNMSLYCGADHVFHQIRKPFTRLNGGARTDISIGERIHNYRMAVAVTGEYYVANGNNNTEVVASVVNSVNSLNAIFGRELSFKFTLGDRIFLFNSPNTDPFTPDQAGGEERTSQAGKVIPTLINAANYDMGHVFHTHRQGDNWSTGGVAFFNSVCSNTTIGSQSVKSSGWSGSFSNNGNGWINLLAHEVGHQFGAFHTFNGSGPNCDNNISLGTAIEIGSGTTIMSYNGICDASQNIPSSGDLDNYFHAISLEQMYDYVYKNQGGNCGNPVLNQNKIPQVVANPCGATLIIPKNTPFYLKANGTWTDSDTHTFCWEQIDEDGSGIKPTQGQIGNAAANSLRSPLFRSYPPKKESFRFFPSMSILNSTIGSNPFEVLPNVPRAINFNVSLRDNNIAGGTVANDELTIQVDDSGPLRVTRPTGGETFLAGQSEIITWNTNGSNTICNKARIKLSMDGGASFPITIAENINYSAGSYNFSVPQNFVSTSNAKIIIECMDFDCFTFFDISDSIFRINSTCAPVESILCRTDSLTAEKGSEVLNLNMPVIIGQQLQVISKTISTSDQRGNVSVFSNDRTSCKTVATSYYYQKIKIAVTETGTYRFNISGAGFVSIFSPGFVPNNGCSGFIASSARESSTPGSINFSSTFSAELRACTEYEVSFYSFATLPVTISLEFDSGPGIVFLTSDAIPGSYQHVFLLQNKSTGSIIRASQNTDLKNVIPGEFILYSAVLPSTINVSSLVNQKLSDITQNQCINRLLNSRSINILPTCEINSISAGAQTSCVPSNNRYTQSITLTYTSPPSTGKININGQLFDVSSSPQNIILTNLDADGRPVNVSAFFTDEPGCSISRNALFTAPNECCPIPLELGPTVVKCQLSGTVRLEAGTDTTFNYLWSKDGQNLNTSQGTVLFVTTSGLYGVTVTHPNGCSKHDTVRVIFNPLPQVALGDAQSFCENEKYIIEATVAPTDMITWFRNDSIIANATTSKLEITKSGIYKIKVKNNFGCENTAQTTVQTIKVPSVELGPNLAKCEGDNHFLNAGSDGVMYTWYKDNVLITTGPTSNQIGVTNSGTYRVVVTNSAQCSTQDQVKIDFFAAPVVEDFPQTVNGCQGTPLLLEAKINEYFSLQWFYNNNPIGGANSLKLQANNSGNYSVEATNLANCRSRKSTIVQIRTLPEVNLGPDITICERTPVLLFAGTEGIKYEWSQNEIKLNNPENNLPVMENGLYKVSVTNSFGCTNIQQKRITFVAGPSSTISKDTSFCDGLNYTIKVNTTAPNPTYQWFRNNEPVAGNGSELAVSSPGNYEAWVTAGTPACTSIKTITIIVHPKPAVNLGNDQVLCDPTSFPILNGGASNTQFQWSFDGTIISNARTVTADRSGTYVLKVKNSFGCERTEQVKITISTNPTLTLSNDSLLCEGSQLNISGQTNGTNYSWRRNNIFIANAKESTYLASLPGLYTLISANDVGCRTEKSILVSMRPKPVLKLGGDTSLCPGATLILNAGNHNSYLWSDGSSLPTLLISAGNQASNTLTKYTVTVKNEFNCESKDSIIITKYASLQAKISANTTALCVGDSVKLTAAGGDFFKWSVTGNGVLSSTSGSSITARPLSNSIFTVEVGSTVCPNLKAQDSIDITLFSFAAVDAGRDTCTIAGRPVKLNATGGVKYIWDNENSISGRADIPNPSVSPTIPTLYRVTITDTNGCIYTDSVNVCIKAADVSIINVITPNNDGKNDELIFAGLADHPGNKLTIFNRWGNIVFEAEDYQINGVLFNGERNGERLPPDTYYYILQYDKKTVKSALTILWD